MSIPSSSQDIEQEAWAPASQVAASNVRPTVETATTSRLSCVALEKSYRKGDLVIPVLRGVDLEVTSGEFLSVSGQSGSVTSNTIKDSK